MKREGIDWSMTKGALIGMIISLTVSASLIIGGFYFKEKMEREFYRNNVQFQSIGSHYLAVDEEEKLIRRFYPQFIALYNNGIIGKEERLNWIETLRKSGVLVKIPSLSYVIKSQTYYSPPYSIDLGRYKLFSSEMSLNMQLLHEGDLFSLFHFLDENAKGAYSVSSCKFQGSQPLTLNNSDASNINARCLLEWYTIKLADGSDINV